MRCASEMVLNVTKPSRSAFGIREGQCHTVVFSFDARVALTSFPGLALLLDQRVDGLSFGVDLVTQKLDLSSKVVDRILELAPRWDISAHLFLSADAQEASLAVHRSFVGNLSSFEVLDEVLFEIRHGVVVLLDHLGEVLQPPADGRVIDRRTNLDTIDLELPHQSEEAFIASVVFPDLGDHKSSREDLCLISR
jgi:hypothetical protein